MAIYGVLPQNIATGPNLNASIQQWLKQQVKAPYDTWAAANNVNAGMQQQSDGTWSADNLGLGIMEGEPDDPSIFERVPTVAYCVDDGRTPKASKPTGLGDGAVHEYHSVTIAIAPAMMVGSDGTTQPDKFARDMLRSYLQNAFTRAYVIPFVDLTQPLQGGGFAQVGMIYIESARPNKVTKLNESPIAVNRNRFELEVEMRIAVQTTNG